MGMLIRSVGLGGLDLLLFRCCLILLILFYTYCTLARSLAPVVVVLLGFSNLSTLWTRSPLSTTREIRLGREEGLRQDNE